MLFGSIGMSGILILLYYIRKLGFLPTSFAMVPLAVPGVYALLGLLEVVTGIPFNEIAYKWDEFAGWQRGILGLSVVTVAFFVFGAIVVAFF